MEEMREGVNGGMSGGGENGDMSGGVEEEWRRSGGSRNKMAHEKDKVKRNVAGEFFF